MFERSTLIDILSTCTSAEEGFPVFLHAHIPRRERLRFLKQLCADYKVYESPDNGIKYVLDFSVAKELFADRKKAVRYTALATDIESPEVDFIEDVLEFFPVFSDEENYDEVRPYAELVQTICDRRVDRLNLHELVRTQLNSSLVSEREEIDLLGVILSLNSEITLKALNWESVLTESEVRQMARRVFSIFRGEVGVLLDEEQIQKIHRTLKRLAEDDLVRGFINLDEISSHEKKIMSAVFAQWITGFLSPCVTWTCYTFLRRFEAGITEKKGNYDKGERQTAYKKGCLRDFIPFQSIHRLIARDCEIDGVRFREGDFICIIPDALYFSADEHVVSSVIGAPNRPCMGMHISSRIVDAYEEYFEENQTKLATWDISYDLQPSLSALEFSELRLRMRQA